jgi:hypothetical protein
MAVAPLCFTTGGALVDNVVNAEGMVLRGQPGGNALYSSAGAALWTSGVGVVANLPRNYPPAIAEALAAGGINTVGLNSKADDVDCEEWFFYRPDGERRDQLHAAPKEAATLGMAEERVAPETTERFIAHLVGRHPAGLSFGGFRRRHPITPADVPPAFWQARAAHLAPNPSAAQIVLAQEARARGLILTVDPGHYAADMDAAARDALLPLLDGFLPSRAEVGLLYPGLAIADALAIMAAATRRFAAVKLGSEGALLLVRGGEALHVPAFAVEAVDPTGAGDVFCGGMLAGLALGQAPEEAIRQAIAGSSLAVETRGPIALLGISREDVGRRLAAVAAVHAAHLRRSA